jgi:hypothetical protein
MQMPNHNEPSEETLKAGALLCPICCVEYIEIEFDFETDGVALQNVKALKCPICQEELFTPEQYDTIQTRVRASNPP